MLSNLKGFFYYRHVIRKFFFDQLLVVFLDEIPNIRKIELKMTTNFKVKVFTERNFFCWISLLEFLTNQEVRVKKCENILVSSTTEAVTNFFFYVVLNNFWIYEFFLRIKFLWFKGLLYNVEEYDITESHRLRLQKKTHILSLEYIKYIEPFFLIKKKKYIKKKKKKSFITTTTIWPDFSFCCFVPMCVIDFCLDFNFYIQFIFNFKNKNLVRIFLSMLNLYHRFFPIKKKN